MTMIAVPQGDASAAESGLADVVDGALIAQLAGQARGAGCESGR